MWVVLIVGIGVGLVAVIGAGTGVRQNAQLVTLVLFRCIPRVVVLKLTENWAVPIFSCAPSPLIL